MCARLGTTAHYHALSRTIAYYHVLSRRLRSLSTYLGDNEWLDRPLQSHLIELDRDHIRLTKVARRSSRGARRRARDRLELLRAVARGGIQWDSIGVQWDSGMQLGHCGFN